MPRILFGLLMLLLARPGFGQELKIVKVFTPTQLQQAARLGRQPTKYLRLARYYPNDSVASLLYYKGTSNRRRARTVRRYSFHPTGRLASRSRRHWLGFQLRRTKSWNEAGQLVAISRRNHWASTSYTYVTRRFVYEQNRLVKVELVKAETGCFSGRTLKRKVVAFTPQGRVVTFPALSTARADSAANRR